MFKIAIESTVLECDPEELKNQTILFNINNQKLFVLNGCVAVAHMGDNFKELLEKCTLTKLTTEDSKCSKYVINDTTFYINYPWRRLTLYDIFNMPPSNLSLDQESPISEKTLILGGGEECALLSSSGTRYSTVLKELFGIKGLSLQISVTITLPY